MRAVTLSELVRWTGADPIGSLQPDRALQAVATDSRSIDAGELFVALRGEHFDGHDFVKAAFARGAGAALVERRWRGLDRAAAGPLLAVDSTLHALGDIARAYRRRWEVPVVAVVGSAGKTTTKEMIAAVLGQRYRVLKTIGSENNEIGVPRTLLQLSPRHEVVVLELAARRIGDIRYLCSVAEPTVGVLLNIGTAHLEFFGSVEGVAKAKGEKKKEQLPGILALRKCEEKKKWRCRGSNPGPLACEASALPLSYIPDVPYATEIPVLVPKVTILSMASSFIRGWRNTGCHTQAVDSDRTVQRSTYPLQSLHPPQAWKSQGGGQ